MRNQFESDADFLREVSASLAETGNLSATAAELGYDRNSINYHLHRLGYRVVKSARWEAIAAAPMQFVLMTKEQSA